VAAVTVTLTGDEARLLRSLDKVVQKERELERKAEQTGRTSERAALRAVRGNARHQRALAETRVARQRAFDRRALDGYIQGLGVADQAVSLLRASFARVDALTEKSARNIREAARSAAQLVQLSTGDPEKLGALLDTGERFSRRSGVPLGQSQDIVFALKSAGLLKAADTFADLSGIVAPEDIQPFAKSIAGFQSGLGKSETGTALQIFNKATVASGGSPAKIPALLTAAGEAAAPASLLGVSDEELLAAIQITATSAGGASKGGTRLRSLLDAFVEQGFEGQTIGQSVDEIAARDLSNADLRKLLGRSEALAAFNDIRKNRDQLGAVTRQVDAANTQNLAGDFVAARDAEPRLAVPREVARSERRLEQSLGFEAQLRNLSDAALNDFEARNQDGFGVTAAFTRVNAELGRSGFGQALGLGADDEQIIRTLGTDRQQQLLEQLLAEQKRNNELVAADLQERQGRSARVAERNEVPNEPVPQQPPTTLAHPDQDR